MILLDFKKVRTVEWEGANVTIDFIPLPSSVNNRFVRETTKEVFKGSEFDRNDRDVEKYNRLVGQYCIKDWTGFVLEDGTEAPCNDENIADVMDYGVFSDFIFAQVFSLDALLKQEVDAAKKESLL